MKIEGRNAVHEALKSGMTVDRLVVQKGMKDHGSQMVIDEAKKRGVKIVFYEQEALDRESKGRHQGFIAEVTDYKYYELEDLIEQAGVVPFFLLLDGVEDPHNLGSVLRVAECAGVTGVVIPRHRTVSVNETVIKVSAGAAAHVKVARVVNINDAIAELKKRGVWVYCAETGGGDVYKTDLKGPVAIVIGGEDRGVGERTKKNCDGIVSIPMKGRVNSLNASVAAAIVVYEKLRQEG